MQIVSYTRGEIMKYLKIAKHCNVRREGEKLLPILVVSGISCVIEILIYFLISHHEYEIFDNVFHRQIHTNRLDTPKVVKYISCNLLS